ncbi:MAG: exonuclease domain-containing protein [Pseudomonadota bacterium]|nr:exonuclease domain-containing protein [Pseudomonadota bacterium]
MKTLLVYDLETSGLTPFDQVLQYAAIRLDAETLEEIEREEIEVAWRRDMVPSPEAFLVHQIPIKGRTGEVSEAVGISKIHDALNHPQTLSGGYNTLGFDDEMLRFSFYRTLFTPYTHQYANGCGRFDILPMVLFYYLFAPDTLKWPQKPDGRPSFKLEDLNRVNQWASGRAHDAMVDVSVTVALMRHLRLNKPMWDYMLGYFDKQTDQKRVMDLMQQSQPYTGVGIMVSLRFGHERNYMAPVLHLGPHHQFKNQSIFIRLDEPISSLDQAVIDPLVVKKKYGEPGFVLPYIDRYREKLGEAQLALVDQNLALLHSGNEDGVLGQHARHQKYDPVEDVDLDASLYQQAFLTREEQTWCEQFHMGGQQARAQLIDNMPNETLKMQALRYLWRYHPEQVPSHLVGEVEASIKDSLMQAVDYRNQARLTPEQASLQVKQHMSVVKDPELLKGLEQMLAHIESLPS